MPMNEYGEIIRNSSPPPPIPPNPNHNPNGNKTVLAILIIIGCIILGSIIGISVYRNINEKESSKAGRTNSDSITRNYSDEIIYSTAPSVTTNEDKTTQITTETKTKETSTINKPKSTDDVNNDYEVFETNLYVHVDEADTLPLRDKPDRYNSSILKRIPDNTRVDVLGYRDTGSEIWFRLDYSGTKGWARGGMLQPKDLDDIWNDEYDLPGMEKWRSKFILDEEFKMFDNKEYADFKGTLYYQPDLSSGVQKRYKSTVYVEVYGVSYDSGEWYYVYTGDSTLENGGYGWVYIGQLSW